MALRPGLWSYYSDYSDDRVYVVSLDLKDITDGCSRLSDALDVGNYNVSDWYASSQPDQHFLIPLELV